MNEIESRIAKNKRFNLFFKVFTGYQPLNIITEVNNLTKCIYCEKMKI